MSRPAPPEQTGDVAGASGSAATRVAVSDLQYAYGDLTVFSGLDFAVRDGEVFCLVGPSGCGKTTLLHLVAGLETPDGGEVRFEGDPVTGPDYRRGVVFQEPRLLPWRTVRENVELGPTLRGEDPSAAPTDRLLDLVGLDGVGDRYPSELSGGMAQRVSLARTLANDPDLLLLDEPTSALDAITKRELQAELRRIVDALDLTAVYVTHDIEEAVYLADRIGVLSERPSRIEGVVEVDLNERDRASEAFVEHRRAVLDLLDGGGSRD
ncbi:MAG: ABC transporter ATP-binding protein [Halobacteriaceae archaeon]